MPGNEYDVARFLWRNIGILELPHLGIIRSVGIPSPGADGYREVRVETDLGVISTQDAEKKADISINGKGVSIKQMGGSFAFNRLQRANILELFELLRIDDPAAKLAHIDTEINMFHRGLVEGRNRPWQDFFSESDFKLLLEYLMMKGSPNRGNSNHPAEYILEAPATLISTPSIRVYTFVEYFESNQARLKLAIRRQWIGQDSHSEHSRAVGLSRKTQNMPWVFEDIAGEPHSGWMSGFPAEQRRTVYFLMIEKEA